MSMRSSVASYQPGGVSGPDGSCVVDHIDPCARPDVQRSLSTYTTRQSGASDCVRSWVLPDIVALVPVSRNCLIPMSATGYRTTRWRKARAAPQEFPREELLQVRPAALAGTPLVDLNDARLH